MARLPSEGISPLSACLSVRRHFRVLTAGAGRWEGGVDLPFVFQAAGWRE